MEQSGPNMEAPKFSSPEEELKYLREKVAEKEQHAYAEQTPMAKEAAISEAIHEYVKAPPAEAVHVSEATGEHHVDNPEFERVVEHLGSIPHREKMRELYRILAEKGVLGAIAIARAMRNPHIEDDFHRVLVEYVKSGAAVPGLDRERDLSRGVRMTLYEVTLPAAAGDGGPTFQDVIAAMDRFLVGMLPSDQEHSSGRAPFTLELALSNFSNDIVFFVAVPDKDRDLFVKQFLGSFPIAKVEEVPGDYNVFNEFGHIAGSTGVVTNNFVFPIQFSDTAGLDPLKVLLSGFSKIERDGEGAAIQFVVSPDTERIVGKFKHAIGQIKQGVPVKRAANIPLSIGGVLAKTFSEFVATQMEKRNPNGPDNHQVEFAEKAVAMIEEKIERPLLRASIRILVSAGSRERAESILSSLEASFNQFTRQGGNGIKFERIRGTSLDTLAHAFTFRLRDEGSEILLSTKELATMYHFPQSITVQDAPQLKTTKFATAPAPAELPASGILIGVNKHRGTEREVRVTPADRLRHFYVIGQTGTGKSKLLKNMIIQDIANGDGCCFIDPHGSDVQDILATIPKERIGDVIYFDPSYTPRPFGLNMLEYDQTKPEQKIFVVNELLSIFRKLYSSTPEAMGPAFEQYFRNATMLVMEDPETGNTLLEIPRVMADPKFRELKLSRCKNPIVVQFWRDIATKTSGEAGLANMIPYITNKFDVFLSNDVMRPIIAQEKSSFNFRDIMDQRKILLVNLAKGRLGEINSHLIGLVLVGKILMAAMSRVDSFGKALPNFYLYIDEFQNVTTDSISAILSEARKYGLSLNIAHQFIGQLEEPIKNAVFGNVGSMVVHRVGAEDAKFLEAQFAPTFSPEDIIKLDNHNAYAKLLLNGKPVAPFNIETGFHPAGHPEIVEQLMTLSYLKYGQDRKIVDDAIMKKYLAASARPAQAATPGATPGAVPPQAGAPRPMMATQALQPTPQAFPSQQPMPGAQFPQQLAHAAQIPNAAYPAPQSMPPVQQMPQQYAPQLAPQYPAPQQSQQMPAQYPQYQQQYPQSAQQQPPYAPQYNAPVAPPAQQPPAPAFDPASLGAPHPGTQPVSWNPAYTQPPAPVAPGHAWQSTVVHPEPAAEPQTPHDPAQPLQGQYTFPPQPIVGPTASVHVSPVQRQPAPVEPAPVVQAPAPVPEIQPSASNPSLVPVAQARIQIAPPSQATPSTPAADPYRESVNE
ncbi:MAG TPA: hypothetical protein VLB83_01495 [Candidatus Paceibacterota bacterium]|nr:hypothetical protein [Candidatus Paceibacterota bacterium]